MSASRKKAKLEGIRKGWADDALADPNVRAEFEVEQTSTEFAEQVRYILKDMEMSQADLARRVALSAPAISQFLTGESNLQLRTMNQIASVLGHELHVLLRRQANSAGCMFVRPIEADDQTWYVPPATELTVECPALSGWPTANLNIEFAEGEPESEQPLPADVNPW